MIFHDNLSSGSHPVTYGWMNEYDKCSNCFFLSAKNVRLPSSVM